jgi:carboxylesterase
MESIKLLKGAAPYFYAGNDVGCLMVHGFTGTPFELRWLGQHLNQQGYTVYGPRLAGHGSTPDDLAAIKWREWYVDVLAAYELLRAQCRKVFVMGLSMGGSLALMLSSQEAVDGLVAMSAPYAVDDPRRHLLPVARLFIATMPKGYDSEEERAFHERILEEQRRRGEEPTGHPNYQRWVVPATVELLNMLEVMQKELHRVSAPALLIHSKADQTVPFTDLQRHYDAIGSEDKRMLALEASDHCVAEDVERETVFRAVSEFIATHA